MTKLNFLTKYHLMHINGLCITPPSKIESNAYSTHLMFTRMFSLTKESVKLLLLKELSSFKNL